MLTKRELVTQWLKKANVYDYFETAPANQWHQMCHKCAVATGLTYDEANKIMREIADERK